jgi:lipopolysaccharide/colanic/teichoic acid biosynthesis glycosyltransferase
MAKRLLDILVSLVGLILAAPVLIPVLIAIWWQDFHSPFYVAPRVGRGERLFKMVKLRSMVKNADKSGVDSTSANDQRITGVGHFVRRYKLDELTQLWNVLIGDMSLVGPRPNVKRGTDVYTPAEKRLLTVRPGVTDLASIVFSDEGDILKDSSDPDLDYDRLIRPWKNRLALIYVERSSLCLDVRIIILTALAIVSKPHALKGVQKILRQLGASEEIRRVARRVERLAPFPPPGATEVVRKHQSSTANPI